MKKLRKLLCLPLVLAFVFSASGAGLSETDWQEADAFFHDLYSRSGAVGGIVMVAQEETPLYQYAWGVTSKQSKTPVTEKTVFKVASESKLISAIGMMQLVEQEKIGLDDPLKDYLGGNAVNPWYPDIPVTLRQVMSHTSSLAATAPYATAPRWDKIHQDSGYFLKETPGSFYQYANLNGGILCSLIESLSGQSLNSYMRDHVFQPLHINAAYASTLLPDSSLLSDTFDTDGTTYMTRSHYLKNDAEYDDSCNPAQHYHASVGGLYISAEGLQKLGMMLCREGTLENVQILRPITVRIMRQDQATLENSSVTGQSPYGLCLFRTEQSGNTWYGHQGRWMGMVVDLFFERETQTTVVFIANGLRHRYGYEIEPYASKCIAFFTEQLGLNLDDFLIE